MTMLEDATEATQLCAWVTAAQQGDREAFGQLFRAFERTVFALALRRVGDHNEAQELTQDVFVQAMLKINQLRDPRCFGGWLRSIVHRSAINRLVRRSPDVPTQVEALETACVDHSTPLEVALKQEQNVQLSVGLSRLRELDRQTLEAFYVRGQSLLEMSVEFQAPLGTIKRRLHVARQRLARYVEPLAI